MAHPPLVTFVVGATGTGKTAVAVALARALKHDHGYDIVCVINCDVLQFYRGLPVATNKATLEELVFRDGTPIPHYFMSFLSMDGTTLLCHPTTPYHEIVSQAPTDVNRGAPAPFERLQEPYHVHHYVRDVEAFLWGRLFLDAQMRGSSCAVVVCGGSNYYSQALLFANTLVVEGEGGCNTPHADEGAEATAAFDANDGNSVQTQCAGDGGWAALHAIDPLAASQVHPQNTRRVARLLQIARRGKKPSDVYVGQQMVCDQIPPGGHPVASTSGGLAANRALKLWGPVPLSADHHAPSLDGPRLDVHPRLAVVWVDADRDWLFHRLDQRVDDMVGRGLLAEVRAFADVAGQCDTLGNVGDGAGGVVKRPRADGAPQHTVVATEPATALLHTGTLATAIGFKEWQPMLEYIAERAARDDNAVPIADDPTYRRVLSECALGVQRATRRYAKQQIQWIRNRFLGVYKDSWWQQRTEGGAAGRGAVAVPFLRFRMDVCLEAGAHPGEVLAAVVGGMVRYLVAAPDARGLVGLSKCVEHVLPLCAEGLDASVEGSGGCLPDTKTLHRCDICGVVASGDAQWAAHLASKRHRGALRHEALVAQQRALGREIPPRGGRK